MFNTHNPIVQLFRTARDRIVGSAPDKYVIRLYGEPDKHGDIFSAPVASEVVGLVVGDVGQSDGGRDLIVEDQSGQLQRVEKKHRKFMAMQYPILFPYGEDGYHEKISVVDPKLSRERMLLCLNTTRIGCMISPLRCRRGTQAYLVDAYCCVEEPRLARIVPAKI